MEQFTFLAFPNLFARGCKVSQEQEQEQEQEQDQDQEQEQQEQLFHY